MTDRLEPLVLGVDCSTTACKAAAWDPTGEAVASGSSPLTVSTPRPGWHEQPADSWWEAMINAIRQVTKQVDAARLQMLCIAHQRETFVPVDERGAPLTAGILWMDGRASAILPELAGSIDPAKFHRLTGKHLSVNLTVAKIAWLRKFQPELFTHACKYLDVHACLVHRLTGQYRTGWGCADPTGLFDLQQHIWAGPCLDLAGIRSDQLPEVSPPGSILGYVTSAAAEACGLPAGLPVATGLGDGQASGLGVNITSPGEAYLSLGTSVISGTYSGTYIFDPAFRTMAGGIPGTFLLETVLLGGGYTLSWFLEKIACRPGEGPAELQEYYDRAAAAVPPGSEGLLTVPYWNSVLGPYWDASASGIVAGWRGIHGLPHLYRSILEGIAFEQHLYTLGVEKALGRPVDRFIAMGGGARSALWRQIIADVTDKPVMGVTASETASLGAGILAATAAGWYPDAGEAARAMTHRLPQAVKPDPARHASYNRLFEEVYRPLFPAIQPYIDRLSSIS